MTTRRNKGSSGATNGIATLIEVASLLEDLLKKENALLAKHKTAEVQGMLERKTALANLYVQQMQAVSHNPLIVGDLDEEEKAGLHVLAASLDALVEENARMLKADMDATERLIKVIYEAVAEQRPAVATYSRDGVVMRETQHVKSNLSVTLNTTL